MFDELPNIRKSVEVEQAKIIDKATLEQEPPQKILTLRRLDGTTLRAELSFSYDETRVSYSKANEAPPYVTITNKEEDSIYWLKRDKKAEEKAYQSLLKTHLQPLQTSHFAAEGDDAIDFYNLDQAHLAEAGWVFESEDDLTDLKDGQTPFKNCG